MRPSPPVVNAGIAVLRPVSYGYVILTIVVFLGPAVILGGSEGLQPLSIIVFDTLQSGLVALQLAALGLSFLLFCHTGPGNYRSILLVGGADALAVANVVRLALNIPLPGLGGNLAQALWFATPLLLLALALWPYISARASEWWIGPMRWILALFPIIFLVAALARIDFRPYTGFQTPTPLAWFLAYAPTLAVAGIAITGWISFEDSRKPSTRSLLWSTSGVLLPAAFMAIITSTSTFAGFVLSATITWGSGYQLFTTSFISAPLAVSFFLVTSAFAAFMVTLVRFRQSGRPMVHLLLALAAVSSGIFYSSVSILGSLVALQILWLNIVPGERPARRAIIRS